MSERLHGRVALVTGAGNGVGKACALALAAEGASVVVNDLGTDEFAQGASSAAADSTVEEIRAAGGKAEASYDSVATSDGCENAVRIAQESFGAVDIVVGCAGAILQADLATPDETYRRFIDLYLSQKFWLARATVPSMAERGWGRFIAATSHGALGTLGSPVFAGAMGGVISFVKAVAHEYRDQGVTANCLAPGAKTRLADVTLPHFAELHRQGVLTDEQWEEVERGPGPTTHVAPIVAWLCSDAASGVSGEVFHSSGGMVGLWSPYREERTIYRGDPRTNPPWSQEELDDLVPRILLNERA